MVGMMEMLDGDGNAGQGSALEHQLLRFVLSGT